MEPYRRRVEDSIRSVTGLNIVLGALIFLTPFFAEGGSDGLTSNLIAGALAMALAGYGLYAATQRVPRNAVMTAAWNIVIGAYVALSPLWLSTSATFAGANVLLGLMLVAAAAYNVYAGTEALRAPRPARR